MLKGIDTLVFDIQDIGARFYHLHRHHGGCMEEAAKRALRCSCSTAPTPSGVYYDGPIQDRKNVGNFTIFVRCPWRWHDRGASWRCFSTPLQRHRLRSRSRQDEGLEARYVLRRDRLPWVNPSPNMRSLDEEIIYTMVALTEANNDLSVGRGTDRPFEYLGAPWVDGDKLTEAMKARNLPGLWFMRQTFIPRLIDVTGRKNYPYQFIDEENHGFRVVITARRAVRPVEAGIHMLDVLLKLHPTLLGGPPERPGGRAVGAGRAEEGRTGGVDRRTLEKRRPLQAFEKARKQVLLYRENFSAPLKKGVAEGRGDLIRCLIRSPKSPY
jgi:hypothetical protein